VDQKVNLKSDQESRSIESNPEKLLIVNFYLIPEKEFYSLNDSIRVCIEIKDSRYGRMDAALEDAKIYEIVGDLFKVTDSSGHIYKITDIEHLAKYYNNLSKKDPNEKY
jgi:hypothetical protein